MQKFQCLLFMLKRSYICYYIICMTVPLISKVMTSQSGYQTIIINIWPNISRSKGNQTMRFGQLIDYNKRNNFCSKIV